MAFCLFWLVCVETQASTNYSSWVTTGPGGRVIPIPDERGNRILDFSNIGYKGGTEAIPDVPVKMVIAPVAGDDGAHIQAAIDFVKSLPPDADGFRGAVLLAAGEYQISNSITINASGIVLRGMGDGVTGTVLRATGTNQRTLVTITGSGSASTVSGTTHNITNIYVPVGARSFDVDTASGLAAGDHVFVRRTATTEWIHDLGMDQLDNPWTPSGYNIDADRTITRIEGNHVTIDGPITCAIEAKYAGGTIRKFTWSGRISNVGIENIRGVSDYTASDDENHGWIFLQLNKVENAWVKHVTSQYYGFACVALYSGTKFVTVTDCQSLDPISQITGGRRYAFVMDDCQFCLVKSCYDREDRHQYVTQSLVIGPNAFVDGVSDDTHAEAGPHHRWATGELWDNIKVNGGDLDAQNDGNFGTGHGWAGANEVIWNSAARNFIVQNPPTARNWLIGSIGTIKNGTVYVGPHDPGTYDSAGSNVFPNSLYYAQLQDRMAAPGLETREYWVGDSDVFNPSQAAGDPVPVDAAWKAAVTSAAVGKPLRGFDVVASSQWVPFTFNCSIGANEHAVAAALVMSIRGASNTVNDDVLYIDSLASSQSFASLGWTPVSQTNSSVRVLDLGDQLNLLADGKLNVAVQNDTGVDWAMLELQVAPNLPVHTNALTPVADALVRAGASAAQNFGTATTLTIKEDTSANNERKAYLRWDLSGVSGKVLEARVRLMPVSVGTNAIEHGAAVANSNTWNESAITWNNQPGAAKRFATWIPGPGVPVEFVVTPQAQDALKGDGQFSLQLYSLRSVGGQGFVDYASREDANPANRPQLLLVTSNSAPPAISTIPNRAILEDGNTGQISFTVGDDETPASALTLSGSSSNPGLAPATNITFTGSGAARYVTVTPLANQSGSAQITVTVSDGTSTAMSSFQLTVIAVNDPPNLAPIADLFAHAGKRLVITNVASDVEVPPQTLTYSVAGAPPGMSVDALTGRLAWRAGAAQAGTTNMVTVTVTDDGSPNLSASRSFKVSVAPFLAPSIHATAGAGGQIGLSVSGDGGPDYVIEVSTNLVDWVAVHTNAEAVTPFEWMYGIGGAPALFYRVRVVP